MNVLHWTYNKSRERESKISYLWYVHNVPPTSYYQSRMHILYSVDVVVSVTFKVAHCKSDGLLFKRRSNRRDADVVFSYNQNAQVCWYCYTCLWLLNFTQQKKTISSLILSCQSLRPFYLKLANICEYVCQLSLRFLLVSWSSD